MSADGLTQVVVTMPGNQLKRLMKYNLVRLRETTNDAFYHLIEEDAVNGRVPECCINAYCMARIYTLPFTRNYDVAAVTLPEPCCEIKPSTVHGLGVFATRDITKGSYVTLYPADDVLFQPKSWTSMLDDRSNKGMTGGLIDTCVSARYTLKLRGEFEELSMLGVVGDPRKHDNPHYLGHMLNDAVKLSNPEAAEVYERISALRENCADVSSEGLRFMIATRYIKAGEELFYCYGVNYWLNQPK